MVESVENAGNCEEMPQCAELGETTYYPRRESNDPAGALGIINFRDQAVQIPVHFRLGSHYDLILKSTIAAHLAGDIE